MSETPENTPPALARFAAALGWTKLRLGQHVLDDEKLAAQPIMINWYKSGICQGHHKDFYLQINESPIGQSTTYEAAVYAIRFEICSGWHAFRRFEAESEILAEAARLDGWLHKRWFENADMRRQYRERHPECAGYSWDRIQLAGPPHGNDIRER